jgi:hypothetical protein
MPVILALMSRWSSFRSERWPLVLGLGVFVFLFSLAWRFYLERMATGDSAFFSWLLVGEGKPYVALGRYGSVPSQLIPLLMVWWRAPLDVVLRAYSLSIVAVHAVVFGLLVWRSRDMRAIIALPISLVAGTRVMFYFGISELYQGLSVLLIVWMLARHAWAAQDPRRSWRWAALALLLNVWVGFYHQLLVLPLFFLIGHELLHRRLRMDVRSLVLAALLISWYAIRVLFMSSTEYEQGRMPTWDVLVHYGGQLGHLASTAHLLDVWWSFKSFVLLGFATILALVYLRRWWSLVWTTLFTLGFMMLILITDRDKGPPTLHENYYPVVGFVWAVVFAECWVALEAVRWQVLRNATLALVLLLGCVQVYRGHFVFTERVAYLDRTTHALHARGYRKALVHPSSFPWMYAFGEWALAFESALVSADRGPDEVVTLFVERPELLLDTCMHRDNVFFGPTWLPLWFTADNLKPDYFRFPVGGYVRVNSVDTLPVGERRIELRAEAPTSLAPAPFTVLPMRIKNLGTHTLGSLDRKQYAVELRYRVVGMVDAPWHVTALEIDVPPGTEQLQGLIVERPNSGNSFMIEVALFLGEGMITAPLTLQIDRASGYSPF